MNNLNVFNTHYSPLKYPSNWIRNARVFFRQFKWAYQRVTRGFCDFDVWDFDTYLSQMMADGIEHLAKTSHSYPGNEEFPTPESWEEYLMKIVALLRYSLNDELPNEYREAWEKTWENKDICDAINNKSPEDEVITKAFLDVEMQNENKKIAAQNEALDMIKHVYNHLWD